MKKRISFANELFRERKFEKALRIYEDLQLIDCYPRSILDFNIWFSLKRIRETSCLNFNGCEEFAGKKETFWLNIEPVVRHIQSQLSLTITQDYMEILKSGYFSADWYLNQYQDVLIENIDPLEHYISYGANEGRDPSPKFCTSGYLTRYPDVKESGINPLLHYLRIGLFEGRSTMTAESTLDMESSGREIPQACIPNMHSWAGLKPRKSIDHATVDVVVPVYQGRAETLRCLHSILAATCSTSFELVVINDAGPDVELNEILQQLYKIGMFTLMNNSENRGFVHTVNLGMALHTDRDVVLLNSDTEVFDGWLDRLRRSAKRHPRIATVTPLSNNATICSYPCFLQDNPFPLEISYGDLDALTSKVNAGVAVEAPTGVGFCMYIKRTALDKIGQFDEAAFGRGYGEENDFCQRAIKEGWSNIVAADVFVHHWGSASFKGEKTERIQAALNTMERLHPNYNRDVQFFIKHDPLLDARCRLDLSRMKRLRRGKNLLIVSHSRGGGVERHIQGNIMHYDRIGYGIYLMRPSANKPSHVVLQHPIAKPVPNLLSYPLFDITAMAAVLKDLGITEIHTHSIVDFPSESPDHLIRLVELLEARWVINVHDYTFICPRINLVDKDGFYCGEPAEGACDHCLSELGSDFRVTDVRSWRAMHRRALFAADRVLVPGKDAEERLRRYFPEVTFEVFPHEKIEPASIPTRLPGLSPHEKFRIVVIGAIGKIKGFDVLLACARHARQQRLPIKFILMGYSMNDGLLREAGVSITGRYLEENAQTTLEKLSPHVVWLPSLCPETYSYTLSVALLAGLPVVAFDIGAIATRIGCQCDLSFRHYLLPLNMAKFPDQLIDRFSDIRTSYLLSDPLQKAC